VPVPLLLCSNALRCKNLPKRIYRPVYIGLIRSPVAYADPHYSTTVPCTTGKKCLTRTSNGCDHFVGPAIMVFFRCALTPIQEPQYSLINDGLGENLCSWQAADLGYERTCVETAPLYEFGDTLASKLPQRSIRWESSRAPRPFRVPIDLIARFEVMRQISRAA
jgi:hypothetical protein